MSALCQSRSGAAPGLLSALVLGAALSPLIAQAQPAADPDWPCVQGLVEEVEPAVLWPIPLTPELIDTWRQDRELQNVARELGELESLQDADRERIASFAAAIPEAQREDDLGRLAYGVIRTVNQQRKHYIRGIKRYTRQQTAIAAQIEQTLNQLADLELSDSGDPAADTPSRAEIEETLAWHERLYDQREGAMRALCEQPVRLEETLGEIVREISYQLP